MPAAVAVRGRRWRATCDASDAMPDQPVELGAVPVDETRTRFTVWAPKRRVVDVMLDNGTFPLERGDGGYFRGVVRAPAGTRYRLRLDGGEGFPDPCSRWQPEGPRGPSVVVDPRTFKWTDEGWKGVGRKGHVVYELHVGAYTREGTYRALEAQLPYLRDLGVTLVELMPLATFPGAFNWGYDGVALFAPSPQYGSPDDLRRLVDRAHALGLGIILDAVYNHLGPSGSCMHAYADYLTHRYPAEWGEPLDFDGPNARGVRDFVVSNACAWIRDYHFDGLRLDATQSLYDNSSTHIVKELVSAARASAPGRGLFLCGESELQDARMLEYGLDAIWADDFHHVSSVAATGAAEAYRSDYEGSARELLACVERNAVYQGQWFGWQKKPHGTPLRTVEPERIVFALQNHDQIANSLHGRRLHQNAGEGLARALTSYFLLAPQTPLLFMGQEYFASTPFQYFVDHEPALMKDVDRGRRDFLSQFPSIRNAVYGEGARLLSGRAAFDASKLNLDERTAHAGALQLHKELLALRKTFDARPDGALLNADTLALRWPGRLLLLSLGPDRSLSPPSEPLLAPSEGHRWKLLFSSEASVFGGRGAFASDGTGAWRIQGRCATLLEEVALRP
jgi:maltooligosyltrehalose trehalohydrolase